MNYPLKILSVAVEVIPFAKTGGFYNVAGSLPPDLKKIVYDVRVLLPKYACTKSDDSIQSFDGKTEAGFKFALLMTGNHFNKLYKTPWPVFPTSLAGNG